MIALVPSCRAQKIVCGCMSAIFSSILQRSFDAKPAQRASCACHRRWTACLDLQEKCVISGENLQ